MINIFNRVYLQLDNYVATAGDQERIIFTDREYAHPFVETDQVKVAGVIDVIKSDAALFDKYGSLDGFLAFLANTDRKLCVVASQENLAMILISIWKSIFKNHTKDSLYKLYLACINSQNLITAHFKDPLDADGLQEDILVVPMPEINFEVLYGAIPASDFVPAMKPESFPVEYFLAGYLSGTNTQENDNVLFGKVKSIFFKNIVTLLSNDRPSFYRTTQNLYRANGNEEYRGTIDPLTILNKDPAFKWLRDENFSADNLGHVRKNYRLSDIKNIFTQYNNVFANGNNFFDMEKFFDIYVTGNIKALIEEDIADENGNIFSERGYAVKVNGLFISLLYHLTRTEQTEKLKVYELAI